MITEQALPVDAITEAAPRQQDLASSSAEGAISREVAEGVREAKRPSPTVYAETDARRFASEEVAIQPGGSRDRHADSYLAARTFNRGHVRDMLSSGVRYVNAEEPSVLDRLSVVPKTVRTVETYDRAKLASRTAYGLTLKATKTLVHAGATRSGEDKYLHGYLADWIGLLPGYLNAILRTAEYLTVRKGMTHAQASSPTPWSVPLAGTTTGLQGAANYTLPGYTSMTLMEFIPLQVALRHGEAKAFRDKAEVSKAAHALIMACWNVKTGGMEAIEAASHELDRAMRQHLSYYKSMTHENWPRIVRAAINTIFSEAAMHLANEHPDWGPMASAYLTSTGQTIGLIFMWTMSHKYGGPNQDNSIQETSIDNDIRTEIPPMAQALVLQHTGSALPIGPELATAVDALPLDAITDEFLEEVSGLYEHQVERRVDLAIGDLEQEQYALLGVWGGSLHMTADELIEHNGLQAKEKVAPAEMSADERRRLVELDYAREGSRLEGGMPEGLRGTLRPTLERFMEIAEDLGHLKAGGREHWQQISDASWRTIEARLEPSMQDMKASAKRTGRSKFFNNFWDSGAHHVLGKYIKPLVLAGAGSGNGLQVMNGGFNISGALGKSVAYGVRARAVAGQFAAFVFIELFTSGPVISFKNDVRDTLDALKKKHPHLLGLTSWNAPSTYYRMVPKTMAATGLVAWGSLMPVLEIGSGLHAMTASTWAARHMALSKGAGKQKNPSADVELGNEGAKSHGLLQRPAL